MVITTYASALGERCHQILLNVVDMWSGGVGSTVSQICSRNKKKDKPTQEHVHLFQSVGPVSWVRMIYSSNISKGWELL
jgi:hypothetical protein